MVRSSCFSQLATVVCVVSGLHLASALGWNLRSKSWFAPRALREQVQGSRHTSLPDMVTTIEDPNLHGHWRQQQQHLQSAFQPLSALRDPVDRKVRIFTLQEMHAVVEDCSFSRGQPDTSVENWRKALKTTTAKVEMIRETLRRFNGYIYECEDPGHEYDTFVAVAHDQVLKTIKITTVETSPNSGVGWCMGPMFSARTHLDEWVKDMLARQIAMVYIYYTRIQEKESVLPFYGHFPESLSEETPPFEPYEHPQVEYIYYEPPTHTWLFGHNMVNTECIFRNRQRHSLVVVADMDEYLFWRPENNHLSLEQHLRSLLPNNTASLSLHTLLYPKSCQHKPGQEVSNSVMNSSHLFWPDDVRLRCKVIIDPKRGRTTDVHSLGAIEPGYEWAVDLAPRQMYFKHIRYGGDDCDPAYRDLLVDETNETQFQAAMANDTAWDIYPC